MFSRLEFEVALNMLNSCPHVGGSDVDEVEPCILYCVWNEKIFTVIFYAERLRLSSKVTIVGTYYMKIKWDLLLD